MSVHSEWKRSREGKSFVKWISRKAVLETKLQRTFSPKEQLALHQRGVCFEMTQWSRKVLEANVQLGSNVPVYETHNNGHTLVAQQRWHFGLILSRLCVCPFQARIQDFRREDSDSPIWNQSSLPSESPNFYEHWKDAISKYLRPRLIMGSHCFHWAALGLCGSQTQICKCRKRVHGENEQNVIADFFHVGMIFGKPVVAAEDFCSDSLPAFYQGCQLCCVTEHSWEFVSCIFDWRAPASVLAPSLEAGENVSAKDEAYLSSYRINAKKNGRVGQATSNQDSSSVSRESSHVVSSLMCTMGCSIWKNKLGSRENSPCQWCFENLVLWTRHLLARHHFLFSLPVLPGKQCPENGLLNCNLIWLWSSSADKAVLSGDAIALNYRAIGDQFRIMVTRRHLFWEKVSRRYSSPNRLDAVMPNDSKLHCKSSLSRPRRDERSKTATWKSELQDQALLGFNYRIAGNL